jgi:arabinogalactan oligomer/maltooligosaccharide transport system permease protein
MKTIDILSMPPWKRFGYRLANGVRRLPQGARQAAGSFWRALRARAYAVRAAAKEYVSMFREGDVRTRLSYGVMGTGCFLRGQLVKGLMYLFLQAAFIVYMATFGVSRLALLPSLGKAVKREVWNEKLQIYEYIQGDNSMLILLFGVRTLFILASFLRVYFASIRTAWRNQELVENGHRPPGFPADLRDLIDNRLHVAFLTPPIFGVFLFTILPLIFMILIAFTNYDSAHQPPGTLFTWVGFENFRNIFWSNPVQSQTFAGVFRWTLVWAFFATFSNYILGMILALMINKKGIRFKKLWRTIFIVTIAVPQFVSLLLMSRLLAEQGALNVLLEQLGFERIPFLTSAVWARITVIVVNIWVGIPYTMLITSGILMNIPAELYESARIDGAGVLKTFSKITMPYMLFVTTPYLITQFIGNINNFNVIYLLSGGGPLSLDYYQAGKTDLLVTWLYKLTVNNQDYNLASAIGIIIFVVSAVLSLVVFNLSASSRKEDTFQ